MHVDSHLLGQLPGVRDTAPRVPRSVWKFFTAYRASPLEFCTAYRASACFSIPCTAPLYRVYRIYRAHKKQSRGEGVRKWRTKIESIFFELLPQGMRAIEVYSTAYRATVPRTALCAGYRAPRTALRAGYRVPRFVRDTAPRVPRCVRDTAPRVPPLPRYWTAADLVFGPRVHIN